MNINTKRCLHWCPAKEAVDKARPLTKTGDHSKQDQILFVKLAKYIVFCVYRRSYQVFHMVPRNTTGAGSNQD